MDNKKMSVLFRSNHKQNNRLGFQSDLFGEQRKIENRVLGKTIKNMFSYCKLFESND